MYAVGMMSQPPEVRLRTQFRERRVAVGLGQDALGAAIGRHQSVISRLESGGIPLTYEWCERLVVPLRCRVVIDRHGARVEPDEDNEGEQ